MAKKLVAKFLIGELTEKELDTLKNWLQEPKNLEYFKVMVNVNQHLDLTYHPIDVEKAYQIINGKLSDSTEARPWISRNFLRYAAVLLILLGTSIGIYYQTKNPDNALSGSISEELPQITLTLEDGTVKVLEEGKKTMIKNSRGQEIVSQENNKLKYRAEVVLEEELVYNELIVPNGKRFNVELADGTFVYLNAGTKLKYPRAFTDPNSREVYLDGEAFFEVRKIHHIPLLYIRKRWI